ncbi:MAG TPA: TonB-dependent receptor [Kofleriaceae bacterium]|nr:TonB-dependent receptor [Kofleriaceae bacterium]
MRWISISLVVMLGGIAAAQDTPPAPAPAPTPAPTPPAPPPEPTPPPAPPPAPAPAPTTPPPAPETKPAEEPLPPVDQPPPPTTPASDEELPPDTGEEVVVITGSRIGDPLGKQQPVLTLSREDLERTGLVNVGDILQQQPVSGGAINGKFNSSGNFGFPPDGGGIGAGAIEADLRYLNSKRVLVLVDGMRWINGSSASGVAAAVDLNTIPLGMIDHIEVLEDGASPIYGSDAIGGVINIITRKEFSGVLANAYAGGFHYGDGFTQKYDVAWGQTTEKMSTIFGVSYLDQRRINSADREISDSPIPTLDNCEAGCSSATPQGRVVFHDPNTNTDQDLTLDNGVTNPMYPGDYHDFTSADRFNFAPYNLVQTPSRRTSVFGIITYKLPHRTEVRGLATFTNRQSINQAAPEPLFIGPEAGNGNRLDTIGVDATNPYNPFGFTFDPATNPFVITRRPIEAGPRTFEQNVDTFLLRGGLDGKFDLGDQQHFTWDATLQWGVNRANQRRNHSFNSLKLQQALGPAYQDANGWHCGTATNPGDPNCVPFDIFGGQGRPITQAMLDYVTFTEHDVSEQRMTDAMANVSGTVAKLPGGELGVAVGVEHRDLSGFFEPDAVVAAGDGADVPAQPTAGHYSVNEAYAELRVPVIKDQQFARLIDINAAGRVSDYSFENAELTGKAGARWKPTEDLVIRASYGLGFRAPSIGELFGSKSRFDAMLVDPCSDFNRPEIPQATRDRCIALGVPANGSYTQLNPQISVTTGGNATLHPERSNSLNVSFAYSPKWADQKPWSDHLDFEVAYWDIQLDGAISAIDAQVQIDRCVNGGDDTLCQGISRTAAGTINGFANQLQNIGGIKTRGVDFTIAWATPMKDYGKLSARDVSSFLDRYDENIPSSEGFSTVARAGTLAGTPERAFPRFKSNLMLEWLYKDISFSLTTRYIHSVVEQCRDLADFPGTCSEPHPEDDSLSKNKLHPTVYNDIQVLWTPDFDHSLSLTAGVNNLFNVDPPTCYSCSLNGFNPQTYDVPGIYGYVSAAYHVQ